MLNIIFLACGLAVLAGIVWQIGLSSIIATASQLGPGAIAVILIPMVAVYALEALGWRLTLGRWGGRVRFSTLFAVRMAGEAVNVTTPAAYIGGEPLKAYLLKRYGVPFVDGLASVVTAKTAMTIAQIAFILLGLVLSFWMVSSSEHHVTAMVLSVSFFGVGVALFMAIQRYGLAMACLNVLRACRIRVRFLESRQAALEELDTTIRTFYVERRDTFYITLGTFFTAWLLETAEVYAILYYLGVPVDVLSSISIAALTVFIKGSTFFIPGSLGAQEGGYVLLLAAFGYSQLTGITFALIRRARELVWILIGLACLAGLRGSDRPPRSESSAPV